MEIEPTGKNREIVSPQSRIEPSPQKGQGPNFSKVLKASLETASETPETVSNKPIEYIVKSGDTLWKIGKQLFNKDPYQVARDNNLSDPDKIFPGQKIVIYPSPPKADEPAVSGEVIASWYGENYHNRITASGQRFDMYKDTLAHKTLPLGTKVRLVNPENGKVAIGVVNDRGPYIKGREVDVSYALAKKLGFVRKGVTKLNIEKV